MGRSRLTKPKTAKGVRTVPIPQGLWDRLWAHIVKWGVPSHGLVFTNLYGHPIRRDNEEKRWRRALKMAGLPYVDIYSARHWLATELAAAGASDEERTAIMGHTDIHTTSVYTHWRNGDSPKRSTPPCQTSATVSDGRRRLFRNTKEY